MHAPAAITRKPAEVSCILLVDKLTPESAAWFTDVRALVDELIVFIDTARADQATRDLAAKVASRMHEIAGRGFIEAHLEEMVRACQTEWILRIDSDEQLTPRWFEGTWRDELTPDGPSSYIVPRRWIHPTGGFLCGAHWWPDPQLRLFRNDPDGIVCSPIPHEPMTVRGAQGYWPHLAIDHHVLRLLNRAEREAKVARYRRLRPQLALGHFYLFEDQEVPICALDDAAADPDAALLSAKQCAAIRLETLDAPGPIVAGAAFSQRVRISNDTERELSSASLFPINLAYHWLDAASRKVEVFDGQRTALAPAVGSRSSSEFAMQIVAPERPGAYLLQVTLVQERVCWLETVCPEIVGELSIQVVAADRSSGAPLVARTPRVLPLRPTESSEVMSEVNSFWDGARLTTLEQLCISSFLENGIAYNLYVYDEPAGLPTGVTLRDAGEILPRNRVFRYAAGDFNRGSVSAFSNLFRYTLIERFGGWWVDTDLCCVVPIESSGPHAFFCEPTNDGSFYIASSLFRAERESAVLRHCLRAFERVDTGKIVHGQMGPRLLTEAVLEHGAGAECMAPDLFFPVPWWDYARLFEDENLTLAECHTVHFWNAMIDAAQLDKDGRYPESTVYERLKARYLPSAIHARAASLDCERSASV